MVGTFSIGLATFGRDRTSVLEKKLVSLIFVFFVFMLSPVELYSQAEVYCFGDQWRRCLKVDLTGFTPTKTYNFKKHLHFNAFV